MKKIPSFTVNHCDLLQGIYVSRYDAVGDESLTTFDLRFTLPNREPVMNTAEIHAIEHLAATFLRNDEKLKDQTIYFGPMGCRTGFYLILKGQLMSEDIVDDMIRLFTFVKDFTGEIPGQAAKDCGNYLDMNLEMAKYWAKIYLSFIQDIEPARLNYPE